MSPTDGFCHPCTNLLTTAIEKCRPKVVARMSHTGPIRIHDPASKASASWGPLEMRKRAADGCYLCALVLRSLNDSGVVLDAESKDEGVDVRTTPEISAWEVGSRVNEEVRVNFSLDFKWEGSNGLKGDDSWGRKWVRLTCHQWKQADSNRDTTYRSHLYEEDDQSNTTSSAASIDQIRRWLQMCQSRHDCHVVNGEPSVHPTRLIDISRGLNQTHLVDSKALPSTFVYATLSHCWGEQPTLRLLHENQELFEDHIEWSSLPKTFQDTLTTCSNLHISYLWIDSLCIIQDSIEDWAHESAKMAQIYAGSYLNFSATASSNSHEGLFRDRNPQVVKRCHFKPKLVDSGSNDVSPEWEIFNPGQWAEAVEDSPLNARAWVHQEQMLAPRNLHFTAAEVFWECNDLRASETFPDGLPAQFIVRREKNKLLSYMREHGIASMMRRTTKVNENVEALTPYLPSTKLWTDMVEDFTVRHLTFETDRLVALSAIARTFAEKVEESLATDGLDHTYTYKHQPFLSSSPSLYLSGLWAFSLTIQLLWKPSSPPKSQRIYGPTPYIAPSWSWASTSCDISYADSGPVTYHKIIMQDIPDSRQREVVTILNAGTTPVYSDGSDRGRAFGSVTSGYLDVKGLLFPAYPKSQKTIVRSRHSSEEKQLMTFRVYGLPAHYDLKATLDDERWLDPTFHFHEETALFCLPIFFLARENKFRTTGLVLARGSEGQYRRVGIYAHRFVELRCFLEMVAPGSSDSGSQEEGIGNQKEEVIFFDKFLPEWEDWRDCLELHGEFLKAKVRICSIRIM